MTSAAELLAELRARGIELVAAGDCLRFRPMSGVSDDEREALRAHKTELLALLAEPGPRRSRDARYAHPWPDALPGLGQRRIHAFDLCRDCGVGSWARFGGRVLCLPCALRRERAQDAG